MVHLTLSVLSLSKMKEELSNAHKNVDFYKSRYDIFDSV